MIKSITLLVSTTLILSFGASAKLVDVVSAKTGEQICHAIVQNDSRQLHRILKTQNIKAASAFSAVACQGQDILAYAENQGATDVSAYLEKKI